MKIRTLWVNHLITMLFKEQPRLMVAIQRQKSVSFSFSNNVDLSSSLGFLDPFETLFFKPYFIRIKIPQSFQILFIFPVFLGKMSKLKLKNMLNRLEQGNPPPFLENIQSQAEKLLGKFWIRQPPSRWKMSKHKQLKSSSTSFDLKITPHSPFGK